MFFPYPHLNVLCQNLAHFSYLEIRWWKRDDKYEACGFWEELPYKSFFKYENCSEKSFNRRQQILSIRGKGNLKRFLAKTILSLPLSRRFHQIFEFLRLHIKGIDPWPYKLCLKYVLNIWGRLRHLSNITILIFRDVSSLCYISLRNVFHHPKYHLFFMDKKGERMN